MSDFCKQIPMQEYQKCFDILNSGKINRPETYRQFLVSVFEVAKNQMGCQDCGFEFSRQERESFGKASELENIIRLNLVNTSPRYICQNVSTIYHETSPPPLLCMIPVLCL